MNPSISGSLIGFIFMIKGWGLIVQLCLVCVALTSISDIFVSFRFQSHFGWLVKHLCCKRDSMSNAKSSSPLTFFWLFSQVLRWQNCWKRQWLMGQNIQNPSSIDAFPTFSYGDVAKVQPMYAVAVCCYIILIELILFPWYWNRFQPIWRIFSIWGNRHPISMVEINPAYDPNSKALRTSRDHQETSGTIETYEQTVRDHMHS